MRLRALWEVQGVNDREVVNGLKALEKVNTALEKCRAAKKRPACILCRPEFYVKLKEESEAISTPEICLGVTDWGGVKTVFGVRLAVTNDVSDNVKCFEVIV